MGDSINDIKSTPLPAEPQLTPAIKLCAMSQSRTASQLASITLKITQPLELTKRR